MLADALYLVIVGGQLFWWLILKDDGRDEVVWCACLYPGAE